MRFFRIGGGVLCLAFLVATICGRAEAHGYLAASFPPAKAHLKTSPHTIRLHFSLRADARYSTIDLENDDGAVLAATTQQKASRDMNMSAPMLSPGRYHVRYRILSPDGDVVQGKIDFIVDE
jgi:copper resistance protein C